MIVVIDIIAAAAIIGAIAVARILWKNRRRNVIRKRVPLERRERIGKSRAAEREWGKRN